MDHFADARILRAVQESCLVFVYVEVYVTTIAPTANIPTVRRGPRFRLPG